MRWTLRIWGGIYSQAMIYNQESMKNKRVFLRMDFIPKVIPDLPIISDHFLFRKSQRSLELANPLTRSLLIWTAQVALTNHGIDNLGVKSYVGV